MIGNSRKSQEKNENERQSYKYYKKLNLSLKLHSSFIWYHVLKLLFKTKGHWRMCVVDKLATMSL
jgi:hypothetical protein